MQTPATEKETKVMEAGIPRAIDETFLMSKNRDFYYQKWIKTLQRDCPYKGDWNPKKV